MSRVFTSVRDPILRRVNKPLWHTAHRLTGVRLAVDVEISDMGQMVAEFAAPAGAVRERLPSPRMSPVEHDPDETSIVIWANDMRQVGLLPRPYGELAIGVPVRYRKRPDGPVTEGYYCLHLTLNDRDALWAGQEIYGFPECLGEVTFSYGSDARCCRAVEDGQTILVLEMGRVAPQPERETTTFISMFEGQLLRSEFETSGESGVQYRPGGAVCTLGDHPVARLLRDLGMETSALWHADKPRLAAVWHKPAERLPL